MNFALQIINCGATGLNLRTNSTASSAISFTEDGIIENEMIDVTYE